MVGVSGWVVRSAHGWVAGLVRMRAKFSGGGGCWFKLSSLLPLLAWGV